MSASADTRRLYRFEELFLHTKQCPGNEDAPIGALRALAMRVWGDYNGSAHECPAVIAGEGVRDGDVLYSFYEIPPVHKIVLTRSQRRPTVLLHEMAHALGKWLHDAKFCELYFELLHKYLGYDLEELELQAAAFKIRTGR